MSALAFAPGKRPQRASAVGPMLQRKCAACGTRGTAAESCGACKEEGRELQRRSRSPGADGVHEAPPIVHDVLNSSGQPLGGDARSLFEPRFGHDFSGVRVHTGSRASASADAVNAEAYTVGHNIVFAAGKYGGAAGNSLLAHELAHVVQQSAAALPRGPLAMSSPHDAAEREADALAGEVMADRPAFSRERSGIALFRKPAAESGSPSPATPADEAVSASPADEAVSASSPPTIGSAASISWIDAKSPAGLFVKDSPPPKQISAGFVTGTTGFRFSNYLHAWVSSPDNVHIKSGGFLSDSGLYRGPSFMGIPSKPYPVTPKKELVTVGGVDEMVFEQTTGARTVSAGKIGGVTGKVSGGSLGKWIDSELSDSPKQDAGKSKPRRVDGPELPIIVHAEEKQAKQSKPGKKRGFWETVGETLGEPIGTLVGNTVTNFPPIWTKVRLRIKANGDRSCELVEKSHFPSVSFYCGLSLLTQDDAFKAEQESWEALGWDGGNPWGEPRPTVKP